MQTVIADGDVGQGCKGDKNLKHVPKGLYTHQAGPFQPLGKHLNSKAGLPV